MFTKSIAPTPDAMDASALPFDVRGTYRPATIGTNRLTPSSV